MENNLYSPPVRWVWQQVGWPHFIWQAEALTPSLGEAHRKLGLLSGRMGVPDQADSAAALDNLLQNLIASSSIEGENLNHQSVRSSLAKRLGLNLDSIPQPTTPRSEGLAQMLLDAITHSQQPLTLERLYQWHHWLFPDDVPRLISLRVGELRGHEPMQVVSGRLDNPRVHFEAPPRLGLEDQLTQFIDWFNQSRTDATLDPLLRAGIAHFWFITLHPFDDGNGRLARALTDLVLAQMDADAIKLYAMSIAIAEHRSDYYHQLESAQSADINITAWLNWFLATLVQSLDYALEQIERTLQKRRFWEKFHASISSAEQRKVLNRLLDGGERGFAGGISAAQYQKVAKVSKATATRHLSELLEKGCLQKLSGGGRSTRYEIRI